MDLVALACQSDAETNGLPRTDEATEAVDEDDPTPFGQDAGLNFQARNHRLMNTGDGGLQDSGGLAGLCLQQPPLSVAIGPHRCPDSQARHKDPEQADDCDYAMGLPTWGTSTEGERCAITRAAGYVRDVAQLGLRN